MESVDFVEWLLPEMREGCDFSSTFRDAAAVLPWLDCTHVALPDVKAFVPRITRAFAISKASCSPFPVTAFTTCEQCACDPGRLGFTTSVPDGGGIWLLSAVGLLSDLEAPEAAQGLFVTSRVACATSDSSATSCAARFIFGLLACLPY